MWLKFPIIVLVYSAALNDSLQTTECLAEPGWLNSSLCMCSGLRSSPWKDVVENCLMMGNSFWYELEMRLWQWGDISIISLQTQPDVGFISLLIYSLHSTSHTSSWISKKKKVPTHEGPGWGFVHIATHVGHGIAEYRIETTYRYMTCTLLRQDARTPEGPCAIWKLLSLLDSSLTSEYRSYCLTWNFG